MPTKVNQNAFRWQHSADNAHDLNKLILLNLK